MQATAARLRVALDRRGHTGQPVRLEQDVRVDQRDELSPRRLESAVGGVGKPGIVTERQDSHVGMGLAQVVDRAVLRAVVDDDHLERSKLLRGDRPEAAGQPVAAVPVRDHDGDRRLPGSAHRRVSPRESSIEDDSGVRILRGIGVVLALVVCAWFALGVRQAHDTSRANSIVSSDDGVSAAQAAHAASLLELGRHAQSGLAGRHAPGRAALAQNDRARAVRIVEDVTRREPMNVEAWLPLAETPVSPGDQARRAPGR